MGCVRNARIANCANRDSRISVQSGTARGAARFALGTLLELFGQLMDRVEAHTAEINLLVETGNAHARRLYAAL
eukprot:6444368-Prymnesium_polylepis.1